MKFLVTVNCDAAVVELSYSTVLVILEMTVCHFFHGVEHQSKAVQFVSDGIVDIYGDGDGKVFYKFSVIFSSCHHHVGDVNCIENVIVFLCICIGCLSSRFSHVRALHVFMMLSSNSSSLNYYFILLVCTL